MGVSEDHRGIERRSVHRFIEAVEQGQDRWIKSAVQQPLRFCLSRGTAGRRFKTGCRLSGGEPLGPLSAKAVNVVSRFWTVPLVDHAVRAFRLAPRLVSCPQPRSAIALELDLDRGHSIQLRERRPTPTMSFAPKRLP
jgi:hypothetical protein